MNDTIKYATPSDKEHLNEVLDTLLLATMKPLFIKIMSEEENKTKRQNDVFNKLVRLFHESGAHSFSCLKSLRDFYLGIAGLGCGYSYRFGKGSMYVDTFEEVPKDMRKYAKAEYKSWSKVSKKNAKLAVSALITDMKEATVQHPDFLGMLEKWERDQMEYFGLA